MMAIPANLTSVVLRGTFITPEGDPSTGTISFTPSSWLINSGANVSIPNSTITKTLGTAGDFEVTLPVTDDADVSPGDWVYSVSEVVDGVSQNYNILLPGTVGGTAYLADIAPAAAAGPEYYSLASSLTIGTVTTLAAGESATASITGLAPTQTLDLGLPTGPAGSAATVTVGTVTAGTAGGTPTVTNSGSSSAAVLDFVLIPGDTGPTGATGATGPQGDAATITVGTVSSVPSGGTATVTNSGTSGAAILDFVLVDGPTGPTGPQGDAATITVGSVTSIAYGGTASVTNTGTSGSAVLDFVLVTGPQGDLAGLTASDPIDYAANNFTLKYGAGLGTATGGTLVADLSDTTPAALSTGAAGTATTISRSDHVHALPTAGDVGAVGTATTITAGTALAGGGDLSASRTLDVVLSDATPSALGTASAGTAILPARADHVHDAQDLSGYVANSLVGVTVAPVANPTFTGVASFPDGSASAPSITNTGDTNTGILFPDANTVAIAVNGTERVRVSPNSGPTSQAVAPVFSVTQNQGSTQAAISASLFRANTALAATIELTKSSNSTPGSNTAVVSGEMLSRIASSGADGTGYVQATEIRATADGTVSTGDVPGRLGLWTKPAAGAITERMRIDSNGLITGTGTSLGAWTAYTPTLGGTGWAIGDGTAIGYWMQIGKLVAFRVAITFGSTSTFGNVDPTVTLPATARSAQQASNVVQAAFADTSLGATYVAAPIYASTTTVGIAILGASGLRTAPTTTTPFTWASTDIIRLGGVYEIA